MIKKIRRKFILITLLVLVAVIGAIVAGINIVNYSIMKDEKQQVIDMLIENGGFMPTPHEIDPFTEKEGEFFRPDLSVETPFRTRYFTVVEKNDGSIVTDTEQIFSVDNEKAIQIYEKVNSKTEGLYQNYMYSSRSFSDGTIYVFVDCEQELNTSKMLLTLSVVIGLLAISLITLLTVIFSKIVTKPIALSYENQKRFITDANHELKTPLTVIGATNEILEIEYGNNEWTDVIDKQVKRLSSLTDELVTLSKMDEQEIVPTFVNFNLSDVVNEMVEPYIMISKNKNANINKQIVEEITINADKELVSKMISILLDNAFKYVTTNGSIDIRLYQDGKRNIMSVYNTCESVPVGNLDYLFDRFYRLDKSRNSETGGFGIGLSIAKMIADLNKAKISAKSDDGVSIVFEVIF